MMCVPLTHGYRWNLSSRFSGRLHPNTWSRFEQSSLKNNKNKKITVEKQKVESSSEQHLKVEFSFQFVCRRKITCSLWQQLVSSSSRLSLFSESLLIIWGCPLRVGHRWPPLRFPLPVHYRLRVASFSPLRQQHRSPPPLSSSCRPGRSLPRRYDPPGPPGLAGRRWRLPAQRISSTSPWK